MTAEAATVGPGIPSAGPAPDPAARGAPPPEHDRGQSGSLVEPQVLYAASAHAAAIPVVAVRLGDRLCDEVRRLLGAASNPLQLAVLAAVRGGRWQDIRERSVAEFAGSVLAQVAGDPHLAGEASAVRVRVLASPSRKVADVLGPGRSADRQPGPAHRRDPWPRGGVRAPGRPQRPGRPGR